jgi:hypothetical protein
MIPWSDMQSSKKRTVFRILIAATLSLAVCHAQGYRAPRTADGKPNFNGIWQAMNTANWDLEAHSARPPHFSGMGAVGAEPGGLGVVEGGTIPYLPAALAKKKENFANRLALDPETRCYMPGVPRAAYMPFPFQIIQSTNKILIAYEYASTERLINMGKPIVPPDSSWMGQSNGRFEGETLVVDATGFNDQTWFDRAGNHHGEDLHVVERYTMTSPDVINYEATIEDSKTFSRPWKISMPLYRRQEKNMQLAEFKCVEFAEELMYGHLRKQPSK